MSSKNVTNVHFFVKKYGLKLITKSLKKFIRETKNKNWILFKPNKIK